MEDPSPQDKEMYTRLSKEWENNRYATRFSFAGHYWLALRTGDGSVTFKQIDTPDATKTSFSR